MSTEVSFNGRELKDLLLRAPRLSLAAAESLTAGHIQALISATPGASDYFRGGVTAYNLEAKVSLLRVNRAAAALVNCVSASVAEQMAIGACELFGADVAVATTGYAEPSVEWAVSEPLAFWALARRREAASFSVRSGRIVCPGAKRIEAQQIVARTALVELTAWLREVRAKQAGAEPKS